MPVGVDTVAAGLEPVEADLGVGDERGEDADGVGTAAHARRHRVGEPPCELQDLRAGLFPDDVVQVAHHRRERVRARDRSEQVMGVVHVGHPVAERLVDGVLERAAADRHPDDLGAEHPHPRHVERLAPGVLLAHVDDAVEAEEGACGGGGDAVLAGPGLGDDPGLAHALGEERLAEHVVDLVRAGVVEVFALEQYACPAALGGETRRLAQRAGPTGVIAEQPPQLGLEVRIVLGLGPPVGDLVERGDERFRAEAAPVAAEVAALARGRGHSGSGSMLIGFSVAARSGGSLVCPSERLARRHRERGPAGVVGRRRGGAPSGPPRAP